MYTVRTDLTPSRYTRRHRPRKGAFVDRAMRLNWLAMSEVYKVIWHTLSRKERWRNPLQALLVSFLKIVRWKAEPILLPYYYHDNLHKLSDQEVPTGLLRSIEKIQSKLGQPWDLAFYFDPYGSKRRWITAAVLVSEDKLVCLLVMHYEYVWPHTELIFSSNLTDGRSIVTTNRMRAMDWLDTPPEIQSEWHWLKLNEPAKLLFRHYDRLAEAERSGVGTVPIDRDPDILADHRRTFAFHMERGVLAPLTPEDREELRSKGLFDQQ